MAIPEGLGAVAEDVGQRGEALDPHDDRAGAGVQGRNSTIAALRPQPADEREVRRFDEGTDRSTAPVRQ